ncbi:MAG: hypothetical protein ACJ74W_18745 [Pyrinomonadaceae bacterium]
MPYVISRCSEDEYVKLLLIIEDRAKFPDSYIVFRAGVQDKIDELTSAGREVYVVDINVHEFTEWCRLNDRPADYDNFKFFGTRKYQLKSAATPERIHLESFLAGHHKIEPLYSDTIYTDSDDN